MEIGISTGLFYKHEIAELLPLIKRAGFDVVEVWDGGMEWGGETHFDHHNAKQVKALQDALWNNQIRALTMHGPFGERCDISVFDEKHREKAVAEMVLAVNTAAKIGAQTLIVHPGNSLANSQDDNEKHRRIECSIQSLKAISEAAKKKNVRLAVENMLGGMVAGESWQLEKIVEPFDRNLVGVCIDVSHASLCKELDKLIKTLGPRIFAVHISDNHGKMDDHLIPGEGQLDFVRITKKLKEAGFNGMFLLEVLGEAVKRKPEEVLKASKQIALKILKHAGV
jgi:sugar phosphate isomerase/epimerase